MSSSQDYALYSQGKKQNKPEQNKNLQNEDNVFYIENYIPDYLKSQKFFLSIFFFFFFFFYSKL